MSKISLFEYAVVNNPEDVYNELIKTGFKARLNPNCQEGQTTLFKALKHYTDMNPKDGYALVSRVHPDRELVLAYPKVDGDSNACGCSALDGKPEENQVATMLAGEKPKPETKPEIVPEFLDKEKADKNFTLSKSQITNILMGAGIGIVLIAIFKGVAK